MALFSKPPQVASTQEILRFAEIHDSIVITKTGELRVILMVSSINFALKSEQEQTAIVFAYQNFLNSLEFPIQIVMQSKKLDLFNYLAKLKKVSQTQTNELLRMQTTDYMDFISRLINVANIMDKKFFVVIPFKPIPKVGVSLPSKQTPGPSMTLTDFNQYKEILTQRVQVIESGLGSIGVRCAQLNTQQIIELFYGIYNPDEAAKQKLTKVEELTTQVVESEIEKPNEPTQSNTTQ